MKARKFQHPDAMALQNAYRMRNADWSPTIDILISICGLGNVNRKQVVEWLEMENKSFSE